MSERDEVLGRVRSALRESPRRSLPEVNWSALEAGGRLQGGSLKVCFARNFAAVRGCFLETVEDLAEFLQKQGCERGYCDPKLWGEIGQKLESRFEIDTEYSRESIEDFSFGITLATGAIAETGTLILTDRDTPNRLAALAPWVHVAVTPASRLHRTVRDALEEIGTDPNVIWVTGPSKTADVEGILIEGVHGPGEQVCLWQDNR